VGTGLLCRIADVSHVKHQLAKTAEASAASLGAFRNVLMINVLLILGYGYLVGFGDIHVWLALLTVFVVRIYPHHGHISWHVWGSYSLYVWWLVFRLRPGDHPRNSGVLLPSHGQVVGLLSIGFFLIIKNAVRRIFMSLTDYFQSRSALPSSGSNGKPAASVDYEKLFSRIFLLMEHVLFTYWGVQILMVDPSSWYYHTAACWLKPEYVGESFRLYYIVKGMSHMPSVVLSVYGTLFNSQCDACGLLHHALFCSGGAH
jgi:hypothetical protein